MTGGNITADIKAGIIPIIDTTEPLCSEAPVANLSCPLAPGDYKSSMTQKLPGTGIFHVSPEPLYAEESDLSLYILLSLSLSLMISPL